MKEQLRYEDWVCVVCVVCVVCEVCGAWCGVVQSVLCGVWCVQESSCLSFGVIVLETVSNLRCGSVKFSNSCTD